jgi:hypothetical protein
MVPLTSRAGRVRALQRYSVSPALLAERLWDWLPVLGVGAALTLYWVAAEAYSESVVGEGRYAHLSQFWCELLQPETHSGHSNAGRSWARAASVLLPTSLVPLWWRVPVLFRAGFAPGRWVAPAGTLAVLSLVGVGTNAHDTALNIAAASGFTAVALTVVGLDRKPNREVFVGILVAGSLVALNYALWASNWFVGLAPLVQKCALVATVAWVMVTFAALRRVTR